VGAHRSIRPEPLICLFLALATIAVYWQVAGFDFTNFDDNVYVTENPSLQAGLTPSSIPWAFTATYRSTWQPLVWLSYMVDYELAGLQPWLYHLTNLLLHTANVLLLFLVLSRMTGLPWRSAFVAALFGLHPLHVESVAWVAGRKDVLSTLFWMLTMWAYVRYAESPHLKKYFLVLLAFALGLMAKPMLVTLPLVLLLLDWWPLGRFAQAKRENPSGAAAAWQMVREKLPLFALAAGSGVITFFVQRKGGAVGSLELYPIGVRAANALVAYASYIAKTLWPQGLAAFYPHPGSTLPAWQVALSAFLLLSASVLALRVGRRRPYVLVGWLWYLITLVPVIGLVQIGGHAMADRFTYVPLIGLFIIAAWGIPDLLAWRGDRTAGAEDARRTSVLAALGIIATLALAACAHVQVGYWRDSVTLFDHAVKVTRRNAVAHNNLGVALVERGELGKAVAHYREALRIKPRYVEAHCNLAIAAIKQGRLDEAIAHCWEALRIRPGDADAHNDLGVALAKQGKLHEALAHFSEALRLDPDKKSARANLARAKTLIRQ